MSEIHSTPTVATSKPAKPYPDFPLFWHAAGTWAKKIRGKTHYFGKDADAALAKYLDQKDALHSGRTPRPDPENSLTVKQLVNAFLNAKRNAVQTGELKERTWSDYHNTCALLVSDLGKSRLVLDLAPEDFNALRNRMAKRWGPVRLGNVMQHINTIFKFAFDSRLITTRVFFGPGWKRPSKKTLRLHRAAQGPRLFTADEIRRMLDAANPTMRAMIYLGINCGFGNSDVGNLKLANLDLDGGWVDFPRPKTGINRRCPLWGETVAAIRQALRPDASGFVFLTSRGSPWAKDSYDNPLSKETIRLLKALHINGRKGLGFYTLRHVFETIGGEAKDQVAVDAIMGHARDDMASVYRERISDDRLRAVVSHVHTWLFPVQ
jgi:integrase